jgi:acetylglutamate kinase
MTGCTVLKAGGSCLEDAAWVAAFAGAVARLEGPVLVVHGGGPEITRVQRLLGCEPAWVEGRRVTTLAGVEALRMVLSGSVNKRLVAALISAGVRAVGISGEDDGVLRAAPEEGMGRTGRVMEARPELLRGWMDRGLTPVLSPLSRGPDGGPLNVNADEAAAAVAAAVGAARLLLLSDVPGVRALTGETLPRVFADEVGALAASGAASGGMLPKLAAAAAAARAGVGEVRIGALEMLGNVAAGTLVGGVRGRAPAAGAAA